MTVYVVFAADDSPEAGTLVNSVHTTEVSAKDRSRELYGGEVEMFDLEGPERSSRGEVQWTTTPPTKPGWYWVWHQVAGIQVAHVFVQSDADDLVVSTGSDGVSLPHAIRKEYFTLWAGPIEAPPLPEEVK